MMTARDEDDHFHRVIMNIALQSIFARSAAQSSKNLRKQHDIEN